MILDDVFPVFGLKRRIAGEDIDDDETSEESVFVEDDAVEARISEKGMRVQFVFWEIQWKYKFNNNTW